MHNRKHRLSWVQQAKDRQLDGVLVTMLDVLEPIAPLASQALYVFQPVAGIFGGQTVVRDIADALDTPDGVQALRDELENNDSA